MEYKGYTIAARYKTVWKKNPVSGHELEQECERLWDYI